MISRRCQPGEGPSRILLIIWGIFANRRLKLYNSNAVCLVTGLLAPLATDHVTFFVLRFLQGLACNSFWSIPYILGEEDKQQKQWRFNLYAADNLRQNIY